METLRSPKALTLPAALAATVALALALGPAGQYLHFAEVAHAVCSEHGEVTHLEHGEGVLHAGHTAASHVDPTPGRDGAGHAHHHCGLATHEHQQARQPAGADGIARAAAAGDDPAPAALALAVGRALYRVAPKGSPPA